MIFFVGIGQLQLENLKDGNLTFPQISTENAGKYTCEAENGIGSILRKSASIVVHGKKTVRNSYELITTW